jgi:hypothetical protein
MWSKKTIDIDATAPGFLAVDSKNNPHILYHPDTGRFTPTVGSYSTWNIYANLDVIDSRKLEFDGMIGGAALALDSHDNPHALCYGLVDQGIGGFEGLINGTLEVLYASWTGTNWTFQVVDRCYEQSMLSLPLVVGAIAFDSEDIPHIVYTVVPFRYAERELRYATSTGSGWNTETIDKSDEGNVNLAMDSAGNAHVMYTKSSQIEYAVSTVQGWDKQMVVDNATFGNMVLDSQGNPHLIYISDDNDLLYSAWEGSFWNTQIIYPNITPIRSFGCLALDSRDQPYVDYLVGDFPKNNLTFASFENGKWSPQVVDTDVYTAGPLVMDSNGNPHISYGGQYVYLTRSYHMYATATLPDTPATPLQLNLSTFIPIIAALILIVVAVAVYVCRKKPRNII